MLTMHTVVNTMSSYGETIRQEGMRAAQSVEALDNANDPDKIPILSARARDAVAD